MNMGILVGGVHRTRPHKYIDSSTELEDMPRHYTLPFRMMKHEIVSVLNQWLT